MRLTLCLALLFAAPAFAAPAFADCVTKDDLKTGITFKLQDGNNWRAQTAGGHNVRFNLTNPPKGTTDTYQARYGVYFGDSRHEVEKPSDDFWSSVEIKWAKTPPEPREDTTWNSSYKSNEIQKVLSSDNWRKHKAEFRFLPAREEELDGCIYDVVAVEVVYSGGMSNYSERFAYFPEIGTGIRTLKRYDTSGREERSGILSMKAAK
jgi:hypothetical protein